MADEDSEAALVSIHPNDLKRALLIDAIAEISFKQLLLTRYRGLFRDITFLGEERLRRPELDLSGCDGLCVLVDAIDGTDLLERGLFNWCCASVFFRPAEKPGRRIQAAFVGLPNGRVYFGTCENDDVLVQTRRNRPPRKVAGPSVAKELRRASLCFYGQKPKNFEAFARTGILRAVSAPASAPVATGSDSSTAKEEEPSFRLYNLGGIPMMVSLVDKQVETASGIDAVVELKGQKPHDVVPGAFLALKAGATMRKLDGSAVTIPDLEQLLFKPAASRIKYVMTATAELAENICSAIPWGAPSPATVGVEG